MNARHVLLLSLLAACGPDATGTSGVPSLGDGKHDVDAVEVREVLTSSDGLSAPTDLAFHPENIDQLWVTNRGSDGMVVADDVSSTPSSVEVFDENFSGTHFLARPSGLAFGHNGYFATSHDQDKVTQPTTPEDFMGPTLWTADLDEFDGGHASHYDMLHNSPNSQGIAWERKNTYWVYDGWHGALTKYDFVSDHGAGGADHSDGVVRRYADGELGYRPNVPSNLVFDRDSSLLYAVDPANARVVVLDTTTGTDGDLIARNYDGTDQRLVDDAVLEVFATAETLEMDAPSGLALHDGLLYVSDFDTGRIAALDLDGNLVDWVDTGIVGLGGLTVSDDGAVWVCDVRGDRVLRIAEAAQD